MTTSGSEVVQIKGDKEFFRTLEMDLRASNPLIVNLYTSTSHPEEVRLDVLEVK